MQNWRFCASTPQRIRHRPTAHNRRDLVSNSAGQLFTDSNYGLVPRDAPNGALLSTSWHHAACIRPAPPGDGRREMKAMRTGPRPARQDSRHMDRGLAGGSAA